MENERRSSRRGPPEPFAPGVVNVTMRHGGAQNVLNTLQTMIAPGGATAKILNAQLSSSHPSKTKTNPSKKKSSRTKISNFGEENGEGPLFQKTVRKVDRRILHKEICENPNCRRGEANHP